MAPRYDCEDQLDPRKQFDLLRVFPMAFTLTGLLLFTSPVVKCIDLAFDQDCYYWMGHAPQVVSFVPIVLLLLVHGLNSLRGQPSRVAVVMGFIGSCLVLVVLFERYMGRGTELGNRFISNDCRSFPAKYQLEREWQAASKFHSECRRPGHLLDGAPALAPFGVSSVSGMIEDCPGYKDELLRHPDWGYLAGLERRHLCGGWCEPGPQLWGFADTPGVRCSAVVGDVMTAKVQRLGTQLFIYCLLILGITTWVLIYLGPHIRALGIDW
mmetsp:Transcript_1996/g.5288  ORF Transcript_1996/g.5288 Transcript_1996/m.5288 type:complete len:268 (-) Transcript_1996:41-844(-)